MTGLVTIPTAAMPADGTVTVGMNLVDRRYHELTISGYDEHPAILPFASVGFLPFMEVGLRFTRVAGVPRQALGDRMVSVRVRLLKEGRHTPAVVLGAHDLVGTRIYHATYVALSKTRDGVPLAGKVGLHAGYGGQWLSLSTTNTQFQGFFGGVSVAPRPWLELVAEHDAERVNAGVRLRVWRLNLLGAAYGMEGLSGGISYTHQVKH